MAVVRLFVRDLGLRSRLAEAAAASGLDVDLADPVLAIVDLTDEPSLSSFLEDRPGCVAIGFYPHVQRALAERARSYGIEPIEKRILFGDTARVLLRFSA